MSNIAWNDSYLIGVDSIDKEHKKLFSTINKLLKFIDIEEKSEWVCREGVKYLKNHAIEHFEHEEAYMKSINYDEFDVHKRLHDNFRTKTLPMLEAEMEENHYSLESIRHFLGVCIGWVVSHTQTEDQAIVGRRISKWKDLPKENEVEALETTITELAKEMLHVDAKIISEQYAGEDFGKMMCFRFNYRGAGKARWEITMIFEDKLMIRIVDGIMATSRTEPSRIDDMTINVTRYLCRQFLEKIRESFPGIDLVELVKESLLTHEQVLKSFERMPPAVSLLYGTGEGYFAFSIATKESVSGKFQSTVDPAHVMEAVKDFMVRKDEEQERRLPKVLIVDDSDFMRVRMAKLLGDKYDIVQASSSIAAIKIITLNRPDLVLMDYEMPICDGRQALEMIRSEKDIADVPVIFLTGKGDIESVRKVMSLKPEGYLLKTMPEENIKKTIDDFFEKRKK